MSSADSPRHGLSGMVLVKAGTTGVGKSAVLRSLAKELVTPHDHQSDDSGEGGGNLSALLVLELQLDHGHINIPMGVCHGVLGSARRCCRERVTWSAARPWAICRCEEEQNFMMRPCIFRRSCSRRGLLHRLVVSLALCFFCPISP